MVLQDQPSRRVAVRRHGTTIVNHATGIRRGEASENMDQADFPVPEGPVMASTSPDPTVSESSLMSMTSALRTVTPRPRSSSLSYCRPPLCSLPEASERPHRGRDVRPEGSRRVAGEDLRGQLNGP